MAHLPLRQETWGTELLRAEKWGTQEKLLIPPSSAATWECSDLGLLLRSLRPMVLREGRESTSEVGAGFLGWGRGSG